MKVLILLFALVAGALCAATAPYRLEIVEGNIKLTQGQITWREIGCGSRTGFKKVKVPDVSKLDFEGAFKAYETLKAANTNKDCMESEYRPTTG